MVFQSRFDKRITLQKPTEARDADTNEKHTAWENVIERMPAGKIDRNSGAKEELEQKSAVRSEIFQDWEIRFIGASNIPKATWRLIDEFGFVHNLIAAPIEIGRRQGWLLKTMLVQ
jgi:hypothetical protein